MFGFRKRLPPDVGQLRAARLTRTAPWTGDGVSAEVVVDASTRRPTPLVLLDHDGGTAVLHLTGLERLVRGRQGVVENPADDTWLTDVRAIAADSPAGEATRGVGPDHVVLLGPGVDPRHDPVRLYAVLTSAAVAELTTWARAAADAEVAARDRAGPAR